MEDGMSIQFVEMVIGACALVASIGGAGAVVAKVISPAKKVLDIVKELEVRSKKDYEARLRSEATTKKVALVMVAVGRALEDHPELNNKQEIKHSYQELYTHIVNEGLV